MIFGTIIWYPPPPPQCFKIRIQALKIRIQALKIRIQEFNFRASILRGTPPPPLPTPLVTTQIVIFGTIIFTGQNSVPLVSATAHKHTQHTCSEKFLVISRLIFSNHFVVCTLYCTLYSVLFFSVLIQDTLFLVICI